MTDKERIPTDYWGPYVRRVIEVDTIKCQELVDGKWVTFRTTDAQANDYAYTDSSGWCRQRATKYIGKGH